MENVEKCLIFVAPNGADTNDGTAEAPFATPQRALDAVRKIISNGLNTPVTVCFSKGHYNVTGIRLTEADSGTAQFPITYINHLGTVRLYLTAEEN